MYIYIYVLNLSIHLMLYIHCLKKLLSKSCALALVLAIVAAVPVFSCRKPVLTRYQHGLSACDPLASCKDLKVNLLQQNARLNARPCKA